MESDHFIEINLLFLSLRAVTKVSVYLAGMEPTLETMFWVFAALMSARLPMWFILAQISGLTLGTAKFPRFPGWEYFFIF